MKKLLLGVGVLVVLIIGYLLYADAEYTPLKQNDLEPLFEGLRTDPEKVCMQDFLGVGFQSELFEAYKFRLGEVSPKAIHEEVSFWENKEVDSKTMVAIWKNCPLESQDLTLVGFTVEANGLASTDCFSNWEDEISDPNNFYSYFSFNELEQYFLLFVQEKKELNYIRRKGL